MSNNFFTSDTGARGNLVASPFTGAGRPTLVALDGGFAKLTLSDTRRLRDTLTAIVTAAEEKEREAELAAEAANLPAGTVVQAVKTCPNGMRRLEPGDLFVCDGEGRGVCLTDGFSDYSLTGGPKTVESKGLRLVPADEQGDEGGVYSKPAPEPEVGKLYFVTSDGYGTYFKVGDLVRVEQECCRGTDVIANKVTPAGVETEYRLVGVDRLSPVLA